MGCLSCFKSLSKHVAINSIHIQTSESVMKQPRHSTILKNNQIQHDIMSCYFKNNEKHIINLHSHSHAISGQHQGPLVSSCFHHCYRFSSFVSQQSPIPFPCVSSGRHGHKYHCPRNENEFCRPTNSIFCFC